MRLVVWKIVLTLFSQHFKRGLFYVNSKQNIVSQCLVQKQSIHFYVLNFHECSDRGMNISMRCTYMVDGVYGKGNSHSLRSLIHSFLQNASLARAGPFACSCRCCSTYLIDCSCRAHFSSFRLLVSRQLRNL